MGLTKLGEADGRILVVVMHSEVYRPTGLLGRTDGVEGLRKVDRAICFGYGTLDVLFVGLYLFFYMRLCL